MYSPGAEKGAHLPAAPPRFLGGQTGAASTGPLRSGGYECCSGASGAELVPSPAGRLRLPRCGYSALLPVLRSPCAFSS